MSKDIHMKKYFKIKKSHFQIMNQILWVVCILWDDCVKENKYWSAHVIFVLILVVSSDGSDKSAR